MACFFICTIRKFIFYKKRDLIHYQKIKIEKKIFIFGEKFLVWQQVIKKHQEYGAKNILIISTNDSQSEDRLKAIGEEELVLPQGIREELKKFYFKFKNKILSILGEYFSHHEKDAIVAIQSQFSEI